MGRGDAVRRRPARGLAAAGARRPDCARERRRQGRRQGAGRRLGLEDDAAPSPPAAVADRTRPRDRRAQLPGPGAAALEHAYRRPGRGLRASGRRHPLRSHRVGPPRRRPAGARRATASDPHACLQYAAHHRSTSRRRCCWRSRWSACPQAVLAGECQLEVGPAPACVAEPTGVRIVLDAAGSPPAPPASTAPPSHVTRLGAGSGSDAIRGAKPERLDLEAGVPLPAAWSAASGRLRAGLWLDGSGAASRACQCLPRPRRRRSARASSSPRKGTSTS